MECSDPEQLGTRHERGVLRNDHRRGLQSRGQHARGPMHDHGPQRSRSRLPRGVGYRGNQRRNRIELRSGELRVGAWSGDRAWHDSLPLAGDQAIGFGERAG